MECIALSALPCIAPLKKRRVPAARRSKSFGYAKDSWSRLRLDPGDLVACPAGLLHTLSPSRSSGNRALKMTENAWPATTYLLERTPFRDLPYATSVWLPGILGKKEGPSRTVNHPRLCEKALITSKHHRIAQVAILAILRHGRSLYSGTTL